MGPTIHTFLFSYFSLHFHENALLLSSLMARWWDRLWRFRLKDLSIDEMVGGLMLWLLSGPPGFTCWIFCSGTVESLSLLYLLFISWFICSRRWCMDKLGVFHANQNLCVLIHIWTKGEVGAVKPFKPSSKIFLLTVPRGYFFCGSFVLFMFCDCHAFASVHCCLVVICWERADLLALVCDVYCGFVTFPCGILG